MVKANESRKVVWMYQAAAGTTDLDIATDITYRFGEYDEDCGDWETPNFDQGVSEYGHYNVRTRKLSEGERNYKPWKHTFLPITPQYLNWFLKEATDAAPDTIQALESGLFGSPMSIRMEELEGTTPLLIQLVDSYCSSLYCRAMVGKPFLVECGFEYGRLEDYRGREMRSDIVSADATPAFTMTSTALSANEADDWQVWVCDGTDEGVTYEILSHTVSTSVPIITLTGAHNISAGDKVKLFNKTRPFLTAESRNAGHTAVKGTYDSFAITWDDGGANIALPECWKAEWMQSQEISPVMDSKNKYQTIYHYNYSPVDITLNLILETGKQWTDYLDREIRELEVIMNKDDGTYYVSHIFTNCHILNVKESGVRSTGHYEAILLLKAEKQEGTFAWEGTDTWGTHFK